MVFTSKRRLSRAATKVRELFSRREPEKPSAFGPVVQKLARAHSFAELAKSSQSLAKNRDPLNPILLKGWVTLARNGENNVKYQDALRHAVIELRDAQQNAEGLMRMHLLDLSARLNAYKEDVRKKLAVNAANKKNYRPWFLRNISSGMDWEDMKMHFPVHELFVFAAPNPKNKAEALYFSSLVDKYGRKFSKDINCPVDPAWVTDFDSTEHVSLAIKSIQKASKKLESMLSEAK